MNKSQKDIFISSEGDKWFERNSFVHEINEGYKSFIKYLDKDTKILEIGCSAGKNLNYFQKTIGCKCYGIDPSSKAIEQGRKNFPDLNLFVGTADELKHKGEFFDFVLFGFCLYLVDRRLLSRTIAEADRVLKNNGYLGIMDFDTKLPFVRDYKHCEGIKTYKYDYGSIFLSFPHYSLAEKKSYSHDSTSFNESIDQRVSSAILFKNYNDAYFSV